MEHIEGLMRGIIGLARQRIEESKKNDEGYLDLGNLGLTSEGFIKLLPVIKQELPNLKVLNLEYNNLEYLPDTILQELNHLNTLNLRYNNITVVPQILKTKPSLKCDLGNNTLITLEENKEYYTKSDSNLGDHNAKEITENKNESKPLHASASVVDLTAMMKLEADTEDRKPKTKLRFS